jgi:hypothetical protein
MDKLLNELKNADDLELIDLLRLAIDEKRKELNDSCYEDY